MRDLRPLVISALARVEVPAAIWRKQRLGELDAASAQTLTLAFEADCFGTENDEPRFLQVAVISGVLEAAAALAASERLRAYDAVQLASALAARESEPGCDTFACFDDELRAAAAAHGFLLRPE